MALGDLLAWQGEVKSAVINYDKVISNEPGHMLAINNSAMARGLAKESLSEALQAIDQAITAYGPMHYLLDTRGIVYLGMGNYTAAEMDFRNSLKSADAPDRHLHLGPCVGLGKSETVKRSLL